MLTRRQFLKSVAAALALTGFRFLLPFSGPEDPPDERPPEGPQPFRIALLSDPHTQAVTSISAGAINGKLATALADFKRVRPDFWLVCGDVSDHGLPGEFAAFKQMMYKVMKPDQLAVTTGNHEFYGEDATDADALRRFTEAFGLTHPYSSHVVGGIHLVMLADEMGKTAPRNRDWAWLTPEQLRWFAQVLQDHRELFTVVCLHQPLQETVLWSFGGNDFAGCGQLAELRAILAKNPQVKLWLSGHTHLQVEAKGQVVTRGGVTYAGLGSTFYQFIPSTAPDDQGGWPGGVTGYRRDTGASQSRLLEVWPDRVVLRARDHARACWLDDQEVSLKRI